MSEVSRTRRMYGYLGKEGALSSTAYTQVPQWRLGAQAWGTPADKKSKAMKVI